MAAGPCRTAHGALYELRVRRDLDRLALSERSGISVSTIGRIERGAPFTPRRSTLRLIADALDCQARDIDPRQDAT